MERTVTIDGVLVTLIIDPHEVDGGQILTTRLPDGKEHRNWIGYGFRSTTPGGPSLPPNAAQKARGAARALEIYNTLSDDDIRRRMLLANGGGNPNGNGLARKPENKIAAAEKPAV